MSAYLWCHNVCLNSQMYLEEIKREIIFTMIVNYLVLFMHAWKSKLSCSIICLSNEQKSISWHVGLLIIYSHNLPLSEIEKSECETKISRRPGNSLITPSSVSEVSKTLHSWPKIRIPRPHSVYTESWSLPMAPSPNLGYLCFIMLQFLPEEEHGLSDITWDVCIGMFSKYGCT